MLYAWHKVRVLVHLWIQESDMLKLRNEIFAAARQEPYSAMNIVRASLPNTCAHTSLTLSCWQAVVPLKISRLAQRELLSKDMFVKLMCPDYPVIIVRLLTKGTTTVMVSYTWKSIKDSIRYIKVYYDPEEKPMVETRFVQVVIDLDDAPLDDDNNGVVVEEVDERGGAPGSPAAAQGG